MKQRIIALAVFALATALGFAATALLADPSATDAPAPHAEAASARRSHGLESPLRLRLASTDRVDLRSGPARLSVELQSLLPRPARLRYAVELVDERGVELANPTESEIVRLSSSESILLELEPPSWLSNGLFLFRVTVAGRAGPDLADAQLEVPFVIADGIAVPLTDEEWLEHSLVNRGISR